ncbi:PAS domain S-box protein [Ideonella sp. DXS29W]|uniref:histidine kinase n=1 Tax=Ideonella lacteola TaxID=2984193 RepID=A0ABU9BVP6_9BURK
MSDLSSPPIELLAERELVGAFALPAALIADAGVVCANEALCRLLRREHDEIVGGAFDSLVVPEDRDTLAHAQRTCLDSRAASSAISARLLARDGTDRPVEIHLRPLLTHRGWCVMATCVDQTDIQFVQNSLFSLTEMLRQIVDGAAIPSLVIDSQHQVTHWNTACEQLTGVSRSEVIGTCDGWKAFYQTKRPMLADLILDAVPADEVNQLYGGGVRTSATIAGGFEAEAFFPSFGEGGTWLYATAAPLRDASGHIIGAIETVQDVTARRKAQEELMRHREELEQLVQRRSAELAATARELERFVKNAPMGVAYSSGGLIRRVNPAMGQIFGYTQEQMKDMPGARCYLSDADYAVLDDLARAVLSRGEPLHHEMWMRHSDGHPIWVQIDAHVADREDVQRGTWWMMQDRTEIQTAQQQLQARFEELQATNHKLAEAQSQLLQQDKMASIGQLAAGVAHEINNPVGFVSSNLNTLRQYLDDLLKLCDAYEAVAARPGDTATLAALAAQRDQTELDYLREDLPQLMNESAEGLGRVKKIVQDLKDFSRVDQADWQEADLNAGIESTLNVVRHEVKYKAEVVKRLGDIPRVLCLAAQLNQVFMNLIVNAAHAIAERGTITLESGTQGPWAWVQVSDTGCGMSEDVRRRIFEPFFTTKEVGKGTGLGLSLSFSIVQKHGGSIQVRSRPGEGSAFRVWVPVQGPGAETAGQQPPAWDAEPATVDGLS